MSESAEWLRCAAHLRQALAWCDELAKASGSGEVVRQIALQLSSETESLQEELHAVAEQTALENVRVAVEAFLAGAGEVQALSDLDYAMVRLRALFGYPPPPGVDRLRGLYHDFENRLGGLRAEAALRQALAQAAASATELKAAILAERIGVMMEDVGMDAVRTRDAVRALLEFIQPNVDGAYSLRQAASRTLGRPPLRHAVVVEDIDHQRAQMRYAVELATAEFPPDTIEEAASVAEAERILTRIPKKYWAETLLVSDLGLPAGDSVSLQQPLATGRALVQRWRPRCLTIAVTGHGRLYKEFETLMASGPDDFVPKREGWVDELTGILHRRFSPRRLADAELDVLTFTGSTALLDGMPIKFTPQGFAWLDALADPRPVQIGVERFHSGTHDGHPPRGKTLRELGLSLIMGSAVTLDDDTARWWEDVAENGRDRHLGEKINSVVRTSLKSYGLAWDGDLVVSDSNADERTRDQVPWDRWVHRLNVREVRRWTSASAYVERGRRYRSRVLVVDPDDAYAEELAGLLTAELEHETHFSTPEQAAGTAARLRPTVVVLGSPELAQAGLREQLVRVLGPTPMIALVSTDDPALRRALLRREGDEGADWRVDQLGRVWHVLLKSPTPRKDVEELAPVLFEYLQAVRRRSVPMRNAAGETVHEIVVPRGGPSVFLVDGAPHSLEQVARSAPEAAIALDVLLTLAELDNLALDSGFLLRRLLLAQARERILARRDYRQLLKRAISTIRAAISKPLVSKQGPAGAGRIAATILRGNDPYTLRGIVSVVEQLPERMVEG